MLPIILLPDRFGIFLYNGISTDIAAMPAHIILGIPISSPNASNVESDKVNLICQLVLAERILNSLNTSFNVSLYFLFLCFTK